MACGHINPPQRKKGFQFFLVLPMASLESKMKMPKVFSPDMVMDQTYHFHQTPESLAKDLLQRVSIQPTDRLYEPFKGEGAFYNNFPEGNPKDWSEIVQGRDYKDYNGDYDWVITNPPFRLETGTKRVNSFWYLLDYYTQRAKKGVAFLGNDRCFCTLTPRRYAILKERGFTISNITVCNIKKWRGRYFFFVLEKNKPSQINYLATNYE
jgi:hypothetical protein